MSEMRYPLKRRRVYVRLQPREVEALLAVAAEERRHPEDQATMMLEQAMRDMGILSEEGTAIT